jgi:RNA polymerase sigma-70 factor, ECF subfamily
VTSATPTHADSPGPCKRLSLKCRFRCGRAAGHSILGPVLSERFAAVLSAAQEGSEDAFSLLFRDANPSLLRYLRVIGPEVAEDVASETWLQVLRGLTAFRGGEQDWRAWLFTISRRKVIDDARRRSRRPVIQLSEVPPGRLPLAADAADIALEHLSTRKAMAMLTALPPLQAEVILLRVVAGLDTEVVAKMLGRSQGAVRVAAHRGLRQLAQIAAEAGVTL